MLKVGLTGSIGSGKTVISKVFHLLGVPVYSADIEAKKRLFDEKVKNEIKRYFGQTVFNGQDEVDRILLANKVFNDPSLLKRLNSIIHPYVKRHFFEWVKKHSAIPYIIHEAAILFESGFYSEFERIITVTAPIELRLNRVIKRDGVGRDKVLSRIGNQWTDENKIKRADYIIYNDEINMVLPQVLRIHKELLLS